MPQLKTTFNPQGQNLKILIQKLNLTPDPLSANIAKIKFHVVTLNTQSVAREQREQELFAYLDSILPRLLQPANFFLTNTSDTLNKLIEELDNLEKRWTQTIINPEITSALQTILALYRDAKSQWAAAAPEQKALLKMPKAQIAMPWSVLDEDDFGFYYIDNQLALSLLSVDNSGNKAKENATGNRAVKHYQGAFYKKNPEHDHIAPGAEFTVGYLLRLIAGYAITPEIDLLVLSNVTIQKDDELQQIRGVVQASQGMGEMSLNDLLLNHNAEVLDRIELGKFTPLIIGLLLANPADGKGDNYRVVCQRNSVTQEIVSWYPVPIDNDEGLGPAIGMVNSSLNGQQKHYVGIKDMVFFFKNAMDKPLDQTFVQTFKCRKPEVILLQFLAGLYAQDAQYARLKLLERLTNEDLFVEGGEAALDIPIKLDPQLIQRLLFKLRMLQSLVEYNPLMTHRQLFEAMEPIAAYAYRVIQERMDQSNVFLSEGEKIKEAYGFMHGGDATTNNMPLTLRELFAPQLNQMITIRLPEFTVTKSLQEALLLYQDKERDVKKKRNASIEQETFQFVQTLDFETNDKVLRLTLLGLIGEYLPFITVLPKLNQEVLNQFFLQAVQANHANSVKALLQMGADVNYRDVVNHEGNTALHIALNVNNISMIEILLANAKRKINTPNNKGEPPIFFAHDSAILKRLIQAGENIEYVNAKEMLVPTVLDRAMYHKDFHWFSILVTEHYAGRNVAPQKALQFIKEGMLSGPNVCDWQKLCQILRRENAEFARLSLFHTMTEQTASGFEITGVTSGTLKINTAIVKQMFNADGSPKRDNTDYGCRAVAKIQSYGQTEAWAKFYPELPGAQQIAECVAQAFADFFNAKNVLAPSELFAFVGPDRKTYAMQISRHVEGRNLQRVVEDHLLYNTFNKKLDQQSFSQLFLLTLWLTPEDDKFDQFIVEEFINKNSEQAYRLVGIDMDHILVDTVIRKKHADGKLHRELQVKSAVYVLDAMLKPFDAELRDKLLHLQPEEFLKACLTKLVAIDAQNAKIFGEKHIKELLDVAKQDIKDARVREGKGSILSMHFTNEIVDGLLNKLVKIKAALIADPNVTCLQLLSAVTPEVGIVIEKQFHLPPNVNHSLERFKNLFEGHYENSAANQAAGARNTTHLYTKQVSGKEHKVKVAGTTVLASVKIATEESVKGREQYGPGQALARVKKFEEQKDNINNVTRELKKGNAEPFVELCLDQHREKVLQTWQAEEKSGKSIFELMDKETRKIVFKNLKGAMTELDLSNCHMIKDDELGEILKRLSNLRRLILSGCTKLTSKILKKIEKYNDSLEVLELNGLPWKEVKLELLNLRRITGQNTTLEHIDLVAPHLEVMDFAESKLIDVRLLGDNLKKLELRGNKKLNREIIVDLVGQSIKLLEHPQNIYLDTPLVATDIIRLCLFYGASVWTPDNALLLRNFPHLSLLGNSLTHADLNTLIPLCLGIQKIDLQGTRIDRQALKMLIEKCPTLQSLTINDFESPQNTNSAPVNLDMLANVFASTHQGEWLIGGAGGQIEWLDNHLRNKQQKISFGEAITAMAVLPDGRIACGFQNSKIKIFTSINRLALDAENIKKPIQELQGNSIVGRNVAGTVVGLKYSAKLGRLVGVSQNKMIKIWSMNVQYGDVADENEETYKCLLSYFDPASSPITALELLTEKEFVVGYADGNLAVWDLETITLIKMLKLNLNEIEMIKKIAPNLVAVVSQAAPESVNIINLAAGKIQTCIQVHANKVSCMQLLTEGSFLATGDVKGVVKIWDIRTGRSLYERTYPAQIKQLAMVGHNRLAVTTTGILQSGVKKYDYPVYVIQFIKNEIKLDLINAYRGKLHVKRLDLGVEISFEQTNGIFLKQWSDLIKATFDNNEVAVGALQEGLYIQVKNFEQLMRMLDWIKVLARNQEVEFIKQNSATFQESTSMQSNSSSLSLSTSTEHEGMSSLNSLPHSPPITTGIFTAAQEVNVAEGYFSGSPFDDITSLSSSQVSSVSFNSSSPSPSSSKISLSSSSEKPVEPGLTMTPRISTLIAENGFIGMIRRRSGGMQAAPEPGLWALPQKPDSSSNVSVAPIAPSFIAN